MTDSKQPYRPIAVLAYVFVAIASILIAFTAMDLWRADLRVPLEPYGDGLLHAVMVKTIVEHGWVLTNPDLGVPGQLDLRDFPAIDNLAVLLIRILAFVIPDWAILLNAFFLLTFALIAMTALYACRRLGLSWPTSILVSLLYALAPYHFRRSVGHLFLSCYYMVPLLALLALRVCEGWSVFERGEGRGPKLRLTGDSIAALVVAVVAGSSGVYYPFFGCAFLAVGGFSGWMRTRSRLPLYGAVVLIALIGATVGANHLPTILHHQRAGDPMIVNRQAWEAETFGLKIAQLVLPMSDHRIGEWADLRKRYSQGPLNNENDMAALGLLAAVGFVALLVRVVLGPLRRGSDRDDLLDNLSVLNLSGVLIGTVGGAGALFALWVSPDIRAYSRISIYLAFFALVAVGRWLDKVTSRLNRPWILPATVAVLIPIGVLDQTCGRFAHFHSNPELVEFAKFGDRIESAVGRGSMIFQLPYFPFPEHGPIGGSYDYDHFRGYVTTEGLRWSYGATRMRYGDFWQARVSGQPVPEMLRTLAISGFGGLYIDRRAYEDGAASLRSAVEVVLGAPPIASDDGKYYFFELGSLAKKVEAEMGQKEFEVAREGTLHPLYYEIRACHGVEQDETSTWQWCRRNVDIWIENPSDGRKKLRISTKLVTPGEKPQPLAIRSSFWNEDLMTSPEGARLDRVIEVPPGTHIVSIRSSAPRVDAPGDPRKLIFRFVDLEIEEVH